MTGSHGDVRGDGARRDVQGDGAPGDVQGNRTQGNRTQGNMHGYRWPECILRVGAIIGSACTQE